jgi:hypothetical protein
MKPSIALLICLSCLTLMSEQAAAAKSTGVPQFDASVQRAVAYITANEKEIEERESSLLAYALLKAGESTSHPIVKHGVEEAVKRAEAGHGRLGYDHIYLAGVDAMLLSDAGPEEYFDQIQKIVDYVQSAQKPDGSWAGSNGPGDTSMNQYGMLSLWAGNTVQARIDPQVIDRCAQWHLQNGNSDGGWAYRPPSNQGSGGGQSTHNCTMAGAGSLGIAKLLLFRTQEKTEAPVEKKFGLLEKVVEEPRSDPAAEAFANYRPRVTKTGLTARISQAQNWAKARQHPEGHQYNQKQYFFYALERAAALQEMGQIGGQEWYMAYGNVLLGLQDKDGSFPKTNTSPRIGAAFAILYFMRSTKQILDKQYTGGVMSGGRNPEDLFGKTQKKKELSSLDVLLAKMDEVDLSELDGLDTNDIVESVQFGSKEELIGQVDRLKLLIESNNAENRKAAYFALGRTGDFSLVPLMIQGLRDPNLDVNVTALLALRYIARKPNGFGIPLKPLAGAETANEETRLKTANEWRTKAWKTWMNWYRDVRPFEETGGLDELEVATPRR